MSALSDHCQCYSDDKAADRHCNDRLNNCKFADQARAHGKSTDGYTAAHEAGRIGYRSHDPLRGGLQIRIYIFHKFRINIRVFNYSHFLSPSFVRSFLFI